MKTLLDPRHKKREKIVKSLYEFGFGKAKLISPEIKAIMDNHKSIDKLISQYAPEWPVENVNRIDLAILRLAIFELTIEKKNPVKVVIDEAVELAKQYGAQNSAKFINGVLGSILEKINAT